MAAFESLQREIQRRVDGEDCLVCGIMTGTSLDGVDVVIVRLSRKDNVGWPHAGSSMVRDGDESEEQNSSSSSNNNTSHVSGLSSTSLIKLPFSQYHVSDLVAFQTFPYSEGLRRELRKLLSSSRPVEGCLQTLVNSTLALVCRLNTDWSREVGQRVVSLLDSIQSGTSCSSSLSAHRGDVVIGSHGQTIWHEPGHSTLQIGDSEILASITGCVVVSNFRATDIAAGGSGAPLVPYLDRIFSPAVVKAMSAPSKRMFRRSSDNVCFQNLGGIGNVCHVEVISGGNDEESKLSAVSPACRSSVLTAFDTGPANVILNEVVEQFYDHFGKEHNDIFLRAASSKEVDKSKKEIARITCDHDGVFSSGSELDTALLDNMWRDHEEFFDAHVPKSSGRERFGAAYVKMRLVDPAVKRILEHHGEESTTSTLIRSELRRLCRTSVEFTVRSIMYAYKRFIFPPKKQKASSSTTSETNNTSNNMRSSDDGVGSAVGWYVVVSGGGVHHPLMMSRLQEVLNSDPSCPPSGVKVLTLDEVFSENGLARGKRSSSGGSIFADAKEALTFALFAHEKIASLGSNTAVPLNSADFNLEGTNVPAATGANRNVFMGQISLPS